MMSAQGKKVFWRFADAVIFHNNSPWIIFIGITDFFKVLPEMYNCIMLCICLRFCCPYMAGKKPAPFPWFSVTMTTTGNTSCC